MRTLLISTYLIPLWNTKYPVRVVTILADAIQLYGILPVVCQIFFYIDRTKLHHNNYRLVHHHTARSEILAGIIFGGKQILAGFNVGGIRI